jgi:hypothetical protein
MQEIACIRGIVGETRPLHVLTATLTKRGQFEAAPAKSFSLGGVVKQTHLSVAFLINFSISDETCLCKVMILRALWGNALQDLTSPSPCVGVGPAIASAMRSNAVAIRPATSRMFSVVSLDGSRAIRMG